MMRRVRWPHLVLCAFVALTIFAPQISPHDPAAIHPTILAPPSSAHLFGTDALGRDLLSRVLYGGRQTLGVATLATAVALVPGLLLGVLWGVAPRPLVPSLTALFSALLAVPGLLVALVLLAVIGRGMEQIALAVGLSQIAMVAQVTRGAVVNVRDAPYIESAHAIGATPRHIIRRYVLPNIWPVIAVYAGVTFSYSVLNGAALSFLGLGELGVPDWGVILAEGRAVFNAAPWVSIFPGLAITALVFAVNALIDRML